MIKFLLVFCFFCYLGTYHIALLLHDKKINGALEWIYLFCSSNRLSLFLSSSLFLFWFVFLSALVLYFSISDCKYKKNKHNLAMKKTQPYETTKCKTKIYDRLNQIKTLKSTFELRKIKKKTNPNAIIQWIMGENNKNPS